MVIRQIQSFCYEKNDIINLSPAFYQTVLRNSIQSLFIEVSKMFDISKRAEGIHRLLLDIQSNIDKFDKRQFSPVFFTELTDRRAEARKMGSLEEYVNYSLEEINRNSNIIEAVKAQRDQYYAHKDSDVKDLESFFEENKVTYEAFQKLLILNTNLNNGLYYYFVNNTTVAPLALGYDDLEKTIHFAEKGVRARKKELLRED